jgi:hypothetical protein
VGAGFLFAPPSAPECAVDHVRLTLSSFSVFTGKRRTASSESSAVPAVSASPYNASSASLALVVNPYSHNTEHSG